MEKRKPAAIGQAEEQIARLRAKMDGLPGLNVSPKDEGGGQTEVEGDDRVETVATDEIPDEVREVHPYAKLPSDLNATAWRYMDYWKFEMLIRSQELYLSRACEQSDEFEGTYPKEQIDNIDRFAERHGFVSIVDKWHDNRKDSRKYVFMSCWSTMPFEQYLMWKSYAADCKSSVAVKSSAARLKRVCDQNIELWPIDITQVKYIDFRNPPPETENLLTFPTVFWLKDVYFSLESELRIVHWPNMIPRKQEDKEKEYPRGITLSIIPLDLIQSVVLSPYTLPAFEKLVRGMLDSEGLSSIPIEQSRYKRLPGL